MIADLFPHAQPGAGLIGGVMIGLAAAIMLLGLGRIAGVSGLAARATGIAGSGAPHGIAIAFILGLPLGACIVASVTDWKPATYSAPLMLVAAGLIVGFGTRLGSGCTSGHGVCGLSRLSWRSVVATGLFMASGFATVAVMRIAGAL
ncbi:hypothetical protein L288_00495 [Sphingobium quisquiliarum P25]|uniref:YeeE/YedE family protein n=1 Tax=Sphingobium quisquiliarum P25 TaxID=1329909 RepID=T0HPR4_9SPHN|nr:YeeE/YedE thiosulfate transporter family protein [Sphingobium quisquiliarum]EQB15042.1 hypothetical protein L288_00495 [Sphingobium quisquiliarum P25]